MRLELTIEEIKKITNELVLSYLDTKGKVALSTELSAFVTFFVDAFIVRARTDPPLTALQKAPTAGEWHKRFTECVSSLRDVKDKLVEKLKEFNE